MSREKMGWNFVYTYAALPELFYAEKKPERSPDPQLMILNEELASELELDVASLCTEEGIDLLAGNQQQKGARPIAQAYAGHQFGHFTMLGDGRAVLLGEHVLSSGKRVDVQLKGSGRTPFSRGGDGRAALGPMLREYLISEAMYALGVPTTRSLAVVTTGLPVYRTTTLQGAILTRIAASHVRVGTFQYVAARQALQELKQLADYVIDRHDPQLKEADKPYEALFLTVLDRQAKLIAQWQLVGFVHGVMNTDNMTISGETIDYGPCAFLDVYNPQTVFSSIDQEGRYAYGNQPGIAEWNLARFAETLLPLFHQDIQQAVEIAQRLLTTFASRYDHYWMAGMCKKLGLFHEEREDRKICMTLLQLMEQHKADFTNTFRSLTLGNMSEQKLFQTDDFQNWHKRWQARRQRQRETMEQSEQLMRESNPAIIPRNHLVEEALRDAEKGNMDRFHQLSTVLKDPYAYTEDQLPYVKPSTSSVPYRTFCGT